MARRARLLALSLGSALALAASITTEMIARRLEPGRIPDHSHLRLTSLGHMVLGAHPYLLWEHEPGTRIENGVEVHINSLGLRGPEPVVPKPAGIRRIMATGDSSVYGHGVLWEAGFPQVATQRLGGAEAGLESVVAAIPGYSTEQTLNLLTLRALALEPDLIVIGNIWSDVATARVQDRTVLDRYQRHERSLAGALDRALRHTATYRLLSWELGVRRGAEASARASWTNEDTLGRGDQPRVPLDDYERNLDAIARLATERGAVAFLILPHPDDLTLHPPVQSGLYLYRDRMRAVAARWNAPLVEGGAVFAAAQVADPTVDRQALFLDRLHPTALGHQLLGEALADALADWERDTRP